MDLEYNPCPELAEKIREHLPTNPVESETTRLRRLHDQLARDIEALLERPHDSTLQQKLRVWAMKLRRV